MAVNTNAYANAGANVVSKKLTPAQIAAKQAAVDAAQKAATLAAKKKQAAKPVATPVVIKPSVTPINKSASMAQQEAAKPIVAPSIPTVPVGTMGSSAAKIVTPPPTVNNAGREMPATITPPPTVTPIAGVNTNAYANPDANIANVESRQYRDEARNKYYQGQAIDYQIKKDQTELENSLLNPAGNDKINTGGGGKSTSPTVSGSSSAVVKGSGETAIANTGTGTEQPASGETIPVPAPPPNIYLDQMNSMTFDYNASTDPSFQQAAASAENAIIQTMIGRGGLYSSVAQSAVATKIGDLAIQYEEMAYQKFTNDKQMMFEQAKFEQERINTTWNQQFQLAQWQSDLMQQEWANNMKIAEFQFAQDKEIFNQKMALNAEARANQQLYLQKQQIAANQKLAAAKTQVSQQLTANYLNTKKLEEMTTRWAVTGYADATVANYFADYGVSKNNRLSDWEDLIGKLENSYADQAYTIADWSNQIGEGEMAADYISNYIQPASPAEVGTSEANSNSNMKINYYNMLNGAINSKSTIDTVSDRIREITGSSKQYEALGDFYYNKLLSDLITAKNDLKTSDKFVTGG